MRNLFAFFAKYNNWFLFVILEIICAVLLFRYNNYQNSIYLSSANALSGKLYEWQSEVGSFFSLTKINSQLTERNLYLERQVNEMSEKLVSLTKDSSYLHNNQLQLLKEYKLIPAKVIANSLNKKDNLITLDKGRVDGIRKDMGVACGNGIVGVVYMVSNHYSVVIPVINEKSNISVMIKGRGYYGYLHWQGGPSDIAYVDDVPRHAHFKMTDEVVTSGYSAIFPVGIKVGKILHVFNSSDGLSYRVQLRLSTDFGNLRDVCVIDDSKMKERIDIMRAAQDSIKPISH
ncbi:MAG: rod shape-determining protein MreC [Prevotella sp.]|nr:rod shape-determining protein MreC [Prevotella sp.]